MIIHKVNLNLVWNSGHLAGLMSLHLDNTGLHGQLPKVFSSATV
jgi:hypothetical protein